MNNHNVWATVFSAGTFAQMLRSATPVALAALGGLMTEHAGIMLRPFRTFLYYDH